MLSFLIMALLIYGAMHLYALGKVWLAFQHSSGLGLALVIVGLLMTISPVILWQMTSQNRKAGTVVASWVTYTWMGFLFLFCSVALVFDFGRALGTLLGFTWHLDEIMTIGIVAALALALLGYGFVEARQMRVERIRITTPKLSPAIGRVTLAQLADLHLGVMLKEEFLNRIIATLQEIRPDIVVATGDIIDAHGNDTYRLAQHFLNFKAVMGAYAVIGNHEHYAGLEESVRFLRNAGFTVLRGESVEAGGILLVGVDDPGTATAGQKTRIDSATRQALASAQKDSFIVLLKHQPVVDSDTPFDLQLSGHVHGGQIFPFCLLTRLAYGVRTGLTQLADGRRLYVSRGAGTWGPPMRLYAEPEITLITIESEQSESPVWESPTSNVASQVPDRLR